MAESIVAFHWFCQSNTPADSDVLNNISKSFDAVAMLVIASTV